MTPSGNAPPPPAVGSGFRNPWRAGCGPSPETWADTREVGAALRCVRCSHSAPGGAPFGKGALPEYPLGTLYGNRQGGARGRSLGSLASSTLPNSRTAIRRVTLGVPRLPSAAPPEVQCRAQHHRSSRSPPTSRSTERRAALPVPDLHGPAWKRTSAVRQRRIALPPRSWLRRVAGRYLDAPCTR